MVKKLFYEVLNGRVLVYDLDGLCIGSFGGDKPIIYGSDERHLRYLTQASLGEMKDLEGTLRQTISERMSRIPRRIKHRDKPTFEFTAKPINRGYQPQESPTVSGHYANPYYREAESERRT